MHRKSRFLFLAVAMTFAFAGCQSHQAKIDALQKQYDDLEAQFRKDCTAEYMKVPPTLSPKCSDEKSKADDAYKQLQAEKSK
jgi:hypothetical protein